MTQHRAHSVATHLLDIQGACHRTEARQEGEPSLQVVVVKLILVQVMAK